MNRMTVRSRARRAQFAAWHGSVLAVFALSLAHPSLVLAQELAETEGSAVTRSEQRAAQAFEAYSKREYGAAVALYLDAYEAAPSGSILYNIARIYDLKLADRPLAMTFYRRYIADPGAYTERIEFANQRLKELRQAEVTTSELEAPGPSPETRDRSQRSQRSLAISAPGNDRSDEDREGWSTVRWTGMVVGAVGLVGVGTGAVFGLSAMSKANTAGDACDGNECTSQRGVDAAEAAGNAATISSVAFAAGGGLLVIGTALFLLGGDEDEAAKQRQAANVRWEAKTTASGASLLVSGSW